MRVSITCRCGGEVFFDLEGTGISTPSDIHPIGDTVKEMMGGVDVTPQSIDEGLEEFFKGKDFKRYRFFQKCPKCGAENIYILWAPLS